MFHNMVLCTASCSRPGGRRRRRRRRGRRRRRRKVYSKLAQ